MGGMNHECFDVNLANDDTHVVRVCATNPTITKEQLTKIKNGWRTDTKGRICPFPGLSKREDDPYFDICTGVDLWPLQGWLECVDNDYKCHIQIGGAIIIDILTSSPDTEDTEDVNSTLHFKIGTLRDYYKKYQKWLQRAKENYKKYQKRSQHAESRLETARKQLLFVHSILSHITLLVNSDRDLLTYFTNKRRCRQQNKTQQDIIDKLHDFILSDQSIASTEGMLQQLDAI